MTTKGRPAAKPKGTKVTPKVVPAPEGDRLNITDVADLLGVHRNTVRNRIRAGLYPSAVTVGEAPSTEKNGGEAPAVAVRPHSANATLRIQS